MTAETKTAPEPPAPPAPRGMAAPLGAGEGLHHQVKPFAAMGALFIAAGAARVAIHATPGVEAEIAWGVSGAAFVIAVVASFASKRRLMLRHLRVRFLAALYLGASWVAAVAHLGMTMGAVAALAVVGTCLSLSFLREHSITSPPEATPLQLVDADRYVARWAQHLGAKGKPLAGAVLLPDPEKIRAGYRYTLELVPGSQTVPGAVALGDQLRGGLRLRPGQEVIVEEHPEEPAPTALLTIVVKSPVKQSRPWPGAAAGFDAATGSVNLGPFVDDEGVARWSVYRANGIFGGFMQGDPGSGKSRMFESIALSTAATQTHPTVIWFADGQGGASSPMLTEHADWAATTIEDFYEMLQAAARVMDVNGLENTINRLNGFTPTSARPGLLIFADELHGLVDKAHILGPAVQSIMLRIAREGRKAGVAIVAADQSPTLDAFGGSGKGMETLRSCLLNGNGVLLRSETNNAKQVFRVDIDPRRFPKWPGYAFLARPDEGARSAPCRGYEVTDAQLATEPQRIAWRALNPRQATVAGERYAKRREIAQERHEALLLRLQMIDAGLLDTIEEMDIQLERAAVAQAEAAKAGVELTFADGIPSIRPVPRFWLIDQSDAKAQPMTPGETKVLGALALGPAKPGEIAKSVGMAESGVHLVLGRLRERGLVEQPEKYQPYRLVSRAA